MNDQFLEITDKIVQLSLWSFLSVFLVLLILIALRMRSRKRRLMALYREEFQTPSPEGLDRRELQARTERMVPAPRQPRMALHALLLSLLVSAMIFLTLAFTPLPFMKNFVTSSAWQTTPLRVTSLKPNRTYNGFTLKGEVWNQGQRQVEGAQAVVTVYDQNREVLQIIKGAVQPRILAPESAGTFTVSFHHDSPLFSGYSISFKDPQGKEIPFVEGFDVE